MNMKKIGLIGFGSIGKKLYEQIIHDGLLEIGDF
jgi:pyrroline-5-carboxylate reductase